MIQDMSTYNYKVSKYAHHVSACITSSIHLGILQSQSVWTLAATIRGSGGRAQAVGKVNPEGLEFGGFHSHGLVILMAGWRNGTSDG